VRAIHASQPVRLAAGAVPEPLPCDTCTTYSKNFGPNIYCLLHAVYAREDDPRMPIEEAKRCTGPKTLMAQLIAREKTPPS
jgi:hypothetical protein